MPDCTDSGVSSGVGCGQWAAAWAMVDQVAKINLNVCKKLDNKVTKVISTASHVVMYSLTESGEWVRLSVLRPATAAADPLPSLPFC